MIIKHFETVAWAPRPRRPDLESGLVHLWRVSPGPLPLILVPEDLAPARWIWEENERLNFLRTRAAVRALARDYLGCDSDEICWRSDSAGETAFAQGDAVRFSSATAGDLGLVAVSKSRGVAVSLEQIADETHFEELAREYFEPEEVWEILCQRGSDRVSSFFRRWTERDAISMAQPSGLIASDSALWSLTPLPGYVAAVTAPDQAWRFTSWDW